MFKKTLALILVISMTLGASATPILDKRSSCQLGNLLPTGGGGDALCSAHCGQQGNKHGGHCDENKVCICNH
ncbi:hypothetical protein O0I10_002643 [Lichtheimia ornata]|uniref:Invertebrate defensins family profile domain-containing protein n=1 Tax=Lichtheimia ornata TaxID=688661 RepID=A0AAD7V9A6_9FUNG|nr:uncharacterized protein O0I10_002643 [Lichtheimia ornata]KAJ8661377.1 hypothetical protein O0I10_002643 [Lichtheimia ornata]